MAPLGPSWYPKWTKGKLPRSARKDGAIQQDRR